MGDFQVLTTVRAHLLRQNVAPSIHLALPPKAAYPLILLELEEMWSPYPLGAQGEGSIQGRVKFKASAYSQSLGMEEVACVSAKMRKALEGAALVAPGLRLTLRSLSCGTEVSGKLHAGQQLRAVHHFYDALVRGAK